jgi:hypothetical protein
MAQSSFASYASKYKFVVLSCPKTPLVERRPVDATSLHKTAFAVPHAVLAW